MREHNITVGESGGRTVKKIVLLSGMEGDNIYIFFCINEKGRSIIAGCRFNVAVCLTHPWERRVWLARVGTVYRSSHCFRVCMCYYTDQFCYTICIFIVKRGVIQTLQQCGSNTPLISAHQIQDCVHTREFKFLLISRRINWLTPWIRIVSQNYKCKKKKLWERHDKLKLN